jgi:hypothetical protein
MDAMAQQDKITTIDLIRAVLARNRAALAILLLVFGVKPTGNRDAGKFAADAPNCRRVANPKA